MAVKGEAEKTAMLRAGKPAAPSNYNKAAGSQDANGAPGVTRKASMPGSGVKKTSVGS